MVFEIFHIYHHFSAKFPLCSTPQKLSKGTRYGETLWGNSHKEQGKSMYYSTTTYTGRAFVKKLTKNALL